MCRPVFIKSMTKGHNIKPSSLILTFWLNGGGSQLQSVQSSKHLTHKGQVLSVCNTQTELYTTVSVVRTKHCFPSLCLARRFLVTLASHQHEQQQQYKPTSLAPQWCFQVIMVRFAYTNDRVSCTNGSVVTGRASLTGQAKGQASDEQTPSRARSSEVATPMVKVCWWPILTKNSIQDDTNKILNEESSTHTSWNYMEIYPVRY